MRFTARFAHCCTVLALGAALAACSSTRSADYRLEAGQTGRVKVWGDDPSVTVTNQGPGTVELDWDPENALPLTGTPTTETLGVDDDASRDLPDGHLFQFTPQGRPARISVEADGVSALGGADDTEPVNR